MNTKTIIAGTLLAAMLVTGASTYAATTENSNTQVLKDFQGKRGGMNNLTDEQKAEFETVKTLLDKRKNGETLTADETTQVETFRENMPERGGENRGERGGKMRGHFEEELTDEEKTQLESMSDEEKRDFFDTKREEHKVQRDARENVIDKLLAGEVLTAEEETLRAEIIKERAERKEKMQEMETKREAIKAIRDKQDAGDTLTEEEQTTLDEMKGNRGEKRGWRNKGE